MLEKTDVLKDCLCADADPAARRRLAALGESGWNEVVAGAGRHGLRPLLYERLSSAAFAGSVPEPVLASLREAFLVNGLRNKLLYADLNDVLLGLRQHGIRVLLLKGAHLAHLVYRTPASRPMADIDLLVRPTDLPGAARVLSQLDYAAQIQPVDIPGWRQAHRGAHHLPAFSKPAHPSIEIHWALPYAPGPGALEGCWQRAQPAGIAGIPALVLSPEDLLLHLCLHCRLHRFGQGLRPMWDIAETLRRYQEQIQWAELEASARTWRAERSVHLALWLADQLAHAPVPPSLLRRLEPDDFDTHWGAWAVEIVLEGEATSLEGAYAMRLAEAGCAWRNSAPAEKLRLVWRKLFPGREYMRRYMAERHARSLDGLARYTCHLTRGLDVLGISLRLAVRGRLPSCGRRWQWRRWLEGSAA